MHIENAIRRQVAGLLTLIFLAGLAGCGTPQRAPFSPFRATAAHGQGSELLDSLNALRAEIGASGTVTAETCEARFKSAYARFIAVEAEAHAGHFDFQGTRRNALAIAEESFLLRTDLHHWIENTENEGALVTPGCVGAARDLIRATRFLEEYLIEWGLNVAPRDKKDSPALFSDAQGYLDRAPGHEDFKGEQSLRSGDVILSRGGAVTSATIARMPDHAGQFSHLSLVYIDPATRQVYTVEAHIENGTAVRPFQTGHAADHNLREVVFRYKGDPMVAHEAARKLYERATKATAAGANIPYDFHMNLADDKELFCTEIVSLGYAHASRGKVKIPSHPSVLTSRAKPFLDALEIAPGNTFAPSDIETDSRFEIVAEWRDVGRIRDTRMKDAIMDTFYDWIEKKGYVLHDSIGSIATKQVAYRLRHWPLFANHLWKGLAKKFPLNMTQRTLGAFTTIGFAGDAAIKQLAKQEQAFRNKNGRPMTLHELYSTLETLRVEDSKKSHPAILKFLGPAKRSKP